LITDEDFPLLFGGLLHPVSTGLWLNCLASARHIVLNIREVCRGIQRLMLRKYIHLPHGPNLKHSLSGFANQGMPFCVGATDGTHILITSPRENQQTIIISKAGIQ